MSETVVQDNSAKKEDGDALFSANTCKAIGLMAVTGIGTGFLLNPQATTAFVVVSGICSFGAAISPFPILMAGKDHFERDFFMCSAISGTILAAAMFGAVNVKQAKKTKEDKKEVIEKSTSAVTDFTKLGTELVASKPNTIIWKDALALLPC